MLSNYRRFCVLNMSGRFSTEYIKCPPRSQKPLEWSHGPPSEARRTVVALYGAQYSFPSGPAAMPPHLPPKPIASKFRGRRGEKVLLCDYEFTESIMKHTLLPANVGSTLQTFATSAEYGPSVYCALALRGLRGCAPLGRAHRAPLELAEGVARRVDAEDRLLVEGRAWPWRCETTI